MITFMVVLFICVAVVAGLAALLIGGALGFLAIFGDAIMFALIVILIVKLIKRRKKKGDKK